MKSTYCGLSLLALVFCLPVLAASEPAASESVVSKIVVPEKSPIDSKSYRGLVLDNGMKVMLVSDTETDQAAASLDVHVGSGSDPEGWNGLAHFLEHMLFLGTGKFPEAGEYQEFIQSRGGSHNAYTAYDHTNYFFSVNFDSLVPALDRFSRFFVDPTFDVQYVERERSVVHSEYQARLKDEGRRIWAAQKTILNPDHPASRFSVGSEETLRDRESGSVRERLIDFYERWYSADIMALTVVGRESLDELEEIVMARFTEVPGRGAIAPLYDQSYLDRELAPVRLDVVPVQELNSATFIFAVPSTLNEYKSKPLSYIANLIGHEGEGSLLAALKEQGWADNLSAGSGFLDQRQGTFQVSIGLTEPGVDHIDEIGSMLFEAIALIRDKGIENWRFEEEKQLGDIAFQFAEEPRAASVATSLSSRMQDYPMQDVLRGPYTVETWDPDRIAELLGYLTPGKLYLQVVSQRIKAQSISPYYGVRYSITPIDGDQVARWQQKLKAGSGESNPSDTALELALPEPNAFIPERLSLLDLKNPADKPSRLDVSGVEGWYRGDQSFQAPRASFFISLKSPAANGSPRQTVLTELLVRTLNDQLNIETYPARLAGMTYSLYRHSRGISARIGGYEDKQSALLDVILGALDDPTIDPDRLELAKADLTRDLRNVSLGRPSSQTVHEIYRLVMTPYWTEEERLAEIDSVTVNDLNAHLEQLTAALSLTTLAHGDVSRDEATRMTALVGAAFSESSRLEAVARPKVRKLEDYDRPHLRTMDIAHTDTAISYYFQGDQRSTPARARATLLAQLAESPFYFDLRTTNRVGYLVFATYLDIMEVPGLLFSVQSPSHTAAELEKLIDAFLEALPEQIIALDEDAFLQTRSGLVAQILQRDTDLASRTDRYWEEIDLGRTDFDSRQQSADAVSSLSKADMVEYVDQLLNLKRRQLVVQSAGTREGAAEGLVGGDEWAEIVSPEAFRSDTSQYFAEEH